MSTPDAASFRRYLLLWVGQFVSTLGSSLTGFGLGVWVYERTHSATAFGLISLAASVPMVLASPFAGALVDRYSRKLMMMGADTLAGIGTLALAILVSTNSLEIWHIYIIAGLGALANTIQWPAFTAVMGVMVPKQHFGRASGLLQFGEAASMIAAPVLAAIIISTAGLHTVIYIDVATFIFAMVVTLLTHIPNPAHSREGQKAKGSLLNEAWAGWQFIRARKGLVQLLGFFLIVNFLLPMSFLLFTPLTLSQFDKQTLGIVMSVGGVGMLLGGGLMAAWGGPKRKVDSLLVFAAAVLVGCSTIAVWPTPLALSFAIFVLMLASPIINAASQAIWLSKTPADMQGRVMSVRRMIAWFMTPAASLLAGPLADHVFEPAMRKGGALTPLFAGVIGAGPGAGIRLMFGIVGVVCCLAGVGFYCLPRLRNVETELPDAVQGPEHREAAPQESILEPVTS
jgi:MFS transporter, DHA3 family, macrolide efflux protein